MVALLWIQAAAAPAREGGLAWMMTAEYVLRDQAQDHNMLAFAANAPLVQYALFVRAGGAPTQIGYGY